LKHLAATAQKFGGLHDRYTAVPVHLICRHVPNFSNCKSTKKFVRTEIASSSILLEKLQALGPGVDNDFYNQRVVRVSNTKRALRQIIVMKKKDNFDRFLVL